MKKAAQSGYAPKIIAFENVTGLLTSNAGQDFASVIKSLAEMGYFVGASIVDARDFLPQSRPRLFVIAVRHDQILPDSMVADRQDIPNGPITKAYDALPSRLKTQWIWGTSGTGP